MILGGIEIGKAPRIAAVIVEGGERAAAGKTVLAATDLFELRADTFKDTSAEAIKKALIRLKGLKKPVLLTIRSRKEGGVYAIPDRRRAELFESLIPLADAVDIELGSSEILKNVVNFAKSHKKKVIVSCHNFKSTPGDKKLHDIVAKARAAGADIVKIAAYARVPGDLKRLAWLLKDYNDLIVIAMGEYGAASRVFFPMLGSLLTYGSVTAGTAPGQMPVKEIKKEFSRYGF
jgi:3-dehydroquinate dehydratase-1